MQTKQECPPTFLALMPCGLKVPFAKTMATFMLAMQKRGEEQFTYAIEGNLNYELSYYPHVRQMDCLDQLPDVMISSDFNAFYHHYFLERFVQPGHFIDVMPYAPNDRFAKAGITDPHHQFTILCVNPLIVVADLLKVGDRPLPRRWEDLLDSKWHRSITLRGNSRFFCHAVLLPLFKEHGIAAMRALAYNVLDGRHPAEMVKTAGGGRSAALYVMPDFFARKIPSHKAIQLIWPEDGALASPVTLLVKKKKAHLLKPITDYLLSEAMAQVFNGARFPTPYPGIDTGLPANADLKWLGWDYIRANDIEKTNAEIDAAFLPAVQVFDRL